jgi:hypothetical protein
LPTKTTKPIAIAPTVALYEKLIATIPGLERKGDANPYTAINGNMFTLLHQSSRLAIRLPDGKREEFVKKYKTRLFEAYMKEYVAVPDAMLKNTKELKKYLEFSYEYAKTLRRSPARRSPDHTSSPWLASQKNLVRPLEFSPFLR